LKLDGQCGPFQPRPFYDFGYVGCYMYSFQCHLVQLG